MSPSQCRIAGRSRPDEHDAVDLAVVVRRCARPRPARGWPSRSPARPRPRRTRTAARRRRGPRASERGARVVGRRARGEPAAARARLGRRAADQLARRRPVEPHAALRGVHRLGHAQAVRPQVAPEGERRLPVEPPGRRLARSGSATTCAAANATRDAAGVACAVERARLAGRVGLHAPAGARQAQRRAPPSPSQLRHLDPAPLAPRLQAELGRAARRARPRGSPTGTARRARRGAGTAPTAP